MCFFFVFVCLFYLRALCNTISKMLIKISKDFNLILALFTIITNDFHFKTFSNVNNIKVLRLNFWRSRHKPLRSKRYVHIIYYYAEVSVVVWDNGNGWIFFRLIFPMKFLYSNEIRLPVLATFQGLRNQKYILDGSTTQIRN